VAMTTLNRKGRGWGCEGKGRVWASGAAEGARPALRFLVARKLTHRHARRLTGFHSLHDTSRQTLLRVQQRAVHIRGDEDDGLARACGGGSGTGGCGVGAEPAGRGVAARQATHRTRTARGMVLQSTHRAMVCTAVGPATNSGTRPWNEQINFFFSCGVGTDEDPTMQGRALGRTSDAHTHSRNAPGALRAARSLPDTDGPCGPPSTKNSNTP
jgi:hypothetical protein